MYCELSFVQDLERNNVATPFFACQINVPELSFAECSANFKVVQRPLLVFLNKTKPVVRNFEFITYNNASKSTFQYAQDLIAVVDVVCRYVAPQSCQAAWIRLWIVCSPASCSLFSVKICCFGRFQCCPEIEADPVIAVNFWRIVWIDCWHLTTTSIESTVRYLNDLKV